MNVLVIIIVVLLNLALSPAVLAEPSVQESISRLRRRLSTTNLRVVTADALGTPEAPQANQALAEALQKLMGDGRNPRLPTTKLKLLTETADAMLLITLADASRTPDQVWQGEAFKKWLLLTERRTDLLHNLNLASDNLEEVLAIIRKLYDHDPQNRDETWPLILAMALVWDTPRPPLHDQIGPGQLPFTPEITRRYDFFKEVLTQRGAPFPLAKLPISAICFIVDTPVPVSELEWAREHVGRKSPQELFDSIRYDHQRLREASAQLQFMPGKSPAAGKSSLFWYHGQYTLENIRKYGGICTDQAYYATLMTRARGIPAILLVGMGRRGGHAWVAYLKSLRQWKTDVGRVEKDKYTTGRATHPQDGRPFNDHVLTLVCRRIANHNSTSQVQSQKLVRLATVLRATDWRRAAAQAAELAVKADATNPAAWHLLAQLQKSQEGLIKVMDRQAMAFKDYPDIVTNFKIKQAKILRDQGRNAEADRLLAQRPQNTRKRDDLTQDITMAQVEAAMKDHKPEKARMLMEKHLRTQKKEAVKVLAHLQQYLALTKETGQTQEAVEFLNSYLRSLRKSFRKNLEGDPRFLNWDKFIMIQAYLNNGDTKKADRIKRKLD